MMRFSHVHVQVRDLDAAVAWFARFLDATPEYQDAEMASFRFDGGRVVVNQNATDDSSILAFRVESCDAAFEAAVAKGAPALEPPEDKSYGVRAAYVRGPGGLLVEFEQPL
jgi:catechol 2,3-dioxygenase-like lactoylglutathione lyase family enzyme